MSDFLGIDPLHANQDIARINGKLDRLPPAIADAVADDVGEYLYNAVRLYPKYKKVTRKAAFGKTFFTKKQRAFFFWALANGRISVPFKRTQSYRNAWKIVGKGRQQILANETEYGKFLQGDDTQSRLQGMIGWEKLGDFVTNRSQRTVEIAIRTARREIKKAGLDASIGR